MKINEEQRIIAERTSGWFAEFVVRTDEKEATANAIADFLMNLRATHLVPRLFHNREPVVLDIGTGTGHLSSRIKKLFEEMNAEGVDYNGIEYDPVFVARSQRQLNGGTVMPGDGLATEAQVIKDTLQLEDQPDFVIGSHSFMYSPNLSKTAETVRDLLAPSSIGLFVNLSPNADTVTVTRGFAQDMGAETDEKLVQSFDQLKMPHHAIHFRAHMNFPAISEYLWKELSEAKPYDEHTNPHEKHKDGLVVRKMVEFVLQRPLEALSQEQRDQYLDGLKKKLQTQDNALYLDNIIEVTAAPNAEKATQRALEIAAKNTNKNLNAASGLTCR